MIAGAKLLNASFGGDPQTQTWSLYLSTLNQAPESPVVERNMGRIWEEVFHEFTMPNSPVGFERSWTSYQHLILILEDTLNRFE